MDSQESEVLTMDSNITLNDQVNVERVTEMPSESEDEDIVFSRTKKKVAHLSDSESESTSRISPSKKPTFDSDSDADETVDTSKSKSRRIINNDSESEDDDKENNEESSQMNNTKSVRIEERNKKTADKFKNILLKHKKSDDSDERFDNSTEETNDEAVEMRTKISQLCDSESSDEGVELDREEMTKIENSKPKKLKKVEEREKGPQRMSAKQAMEQMQKINSESNRMMREKEVYLPYHRPKQISLKEMMAKKNIQFVTGIKKPTLRMDKDQLKEYAEQLKKREKEIVEMYESENSEDDEETSKQPELTIACEENKSDEPQILIDTEKTQLSVENQCNEENNTEFTNIPESTNDCNSSNDVNMEECNNKDDLKECVDDKNIENKDIANIDSIIERLLKDDMEMETEIDNEKTELVNCNEISIKEKNIDKRFISNTVIQENVEDMTEECTILDFKRQLIEQLPSSLPVKPILKSSDDGFIDLTPSVTVNEESKGINAFKKRFFFNASLKTPEEKEREKEKKILPGTALMDFKRKLEDQICEKRLREWEKKREEELSRKREENPEGDLSDCEELLKEETGKYDTNVEENILINEKEESDVEDEEEPIEDDVVMKESRKQKCNYIEDEAELDEDEDDDDDDEEEESEAESIIIPTEKRKLVRIIKPTDSSDEEDNTKVDENNAELAKEVLTFKNPESADLFSSQENKKNESFSSDDYMPLGQKMSSDISESDLKVGSTGKDDLAGCMPPSDISTENTTLNKSMDSQLSLTKLDNIMTQQENVIEIPKFSEPYKNLFSEDTENVQNTQDIADMCSGKFPSQKIDTSPVCNGEMSQNTENELMELCTGKFFGLENVSVSHTEDKTNKNQKDDVKIIVPTNKTKTKVDIKSFFLPKNVSADKDNKDVSKTIQNEDVTEELSLKYCISSSSSDEKEDKETTNSIKNKTLKSRRDRNKRRKAKPLAISDDESESENEMEDEEESYNSDDENLVDEEKQIEYDSEENEIEMETEEVIVKAKPKKKSSEFFEQEAEITTDDEWKGSGDEDEKGLDEFEWEEGDADRLDQRKVAKELERIHRHQMLDQDNREIKLLQDILLEDGDLEGGTRERKFRWKNIDSNMESGAILDNEDENGMDDEQTEEQWRRQRYERETFLNQLKNKYNETKSGESETSDTQAISRLSFIKSTLQKIKRIDQVENVTKDVQNNETCDDTEKIAKKPSKDIPSPVKKPLIIQSSFKGSFLMKSRAALDRLASMAKNNTDPNGEEPTFNISSLAPGKRNNFVFTTVSPPCNKNMAEDVKAMKRRLASEEPETSGESSKKLKISNCHTSTSRKSLLDHIE